MANEIVVSGLGDQTTAQILAAEFALLLADRQALPAHPALMYIGGVNGMGSNVVKQAFVGLQGYDLGATETEGTGPSNSAFADASATVTVAFKSKVYEASDLSKLIDKTGSLKPSTLAMDALTTYGVTMRDMAANLMGGFSTVVGSTGVNASFANFLDAITTLQIANVEGPYLSILHPVQWGDIRKDVATASGGAIQWNQGSQAIIDAMKTIGYQGSFAGVDVFVTTSVPTANAGADRAGGMFGKTAIVWADGLVVVEDPINQMAVGPKVMFERVRNGAAGLTKYATRFPIGMSEGQDAAGVAITTDA